MAVTGGTFARSHHEPQVNAETLLTIMRSAVGHALLYFRWRTGLTGPGCSYRVSVQSRGAGRSGLPTGNGNRRRANRGVRRSHEPQTGPDSKATSVAGRRC